MQFNITFDVANSPDLASLSSAEQQAVLDTANAAATIWSWYLTAANVTLDLALMVDNSLFSGSTLAEGGPANFTRTGADFSGKHVYESNTAVELRTGVDRNGSASDLHVGLTVNSIRNMMTFKTDDYAAVTGGRSDALSVFLHEIGHGLGFVYLTDPSFPGVGIFDTFVQNGVFTGPNAEQASGLLSGIPLEPGSESHLAESGSTASDLMSPSLTRGTNIHISALDLGILQDIGVPLRLATGGNDTMHAISGVALHLGGGNDTGYALASGSTIYGDDGDDALYGARGNDTLFGGNGVDTAFYSSVALNYQITSLSSTSVQIKDLRPGAPDGTDILTDVERVRWSDGSVSVLLASAAGRTNDFNGDGKSDILWQNDNGQAALWLMNGVTQIGNNAVGANPGPTWHIKGAGDFNGDGSADILWQNDNGQAALWLMNGFTQIGNDAVGGNPGPSWHIKGTGDFNGDGKADILWQNDNGQAALWLMNGLAQIGNDAVGGNPGPSWHVKGAGDFDGDGKADILWQNDDGRAQIWTVNGLAVTGGGIVGTNPGSTWHIKTAADINGDGLSDILWQGDSGQAMGWQMNGTTILSNAAIGSNPGASWHMIAASS